MIYENVELYNVAELIAPEEGPGALISRIPDDIRTTLNESAKNNALCASGCEVRFNLEGAEAKIVLKSDGECPVPAEILQGSFPVSWHRVGTEPTEITVSHPANLDLLDRLAKEKGLPFDSRLTRVILPHVPNIRLVGVEGETSPPRDGQTPGLKCLCYGSSITHGACATRPTGTYAARTAQLLGADLINLGFGGGAHCESQIADYIAGRTDWDLATLEMGINMYAPGRFEIDEFQSRVEYLVEKVARSDPDKWVFCMDMFTFYADYDPGSRRQRAFRKIVKRATQRPQLPRAVYVDGRRLLRLPSGLTFDLVHPAPAGMEEIAQNLSRVIRGKVGKAPLGA
jgi:lysophospholipase L1-like esterase